ncbi:colicin V synthesis protein [Enterobacteriaceae bacterium C23F]
MRELNVMELDAVSGAGLWSALTSSVLGAVVGVAAGALVGGSAATKGGGILGLGIIAEGVGMVGGAILGGIACTVGAFIVGYNDPDTVSSLAIQAGTQMINSIGN